jgi:uncharacterized protein (PEP-CTERM system associated)
LSLLAATRAGAQEAGTGIPGVPPISGALLPSTGVNPSDPNLRSDLLSAFGQNTAPTPGGAAAGPNWQYTPAITVSEAFTDNANNFNGFATGATAHRDDAITLIQPSLLVIGNTQLVQVNLNYAPTGVIYAQNSDYSQFRQQFSGDILATAIPGLLFVDTRGSVYQAPVFGGTGVVNTELLPPSQRETNSNISVTPYLVKPFGGAGTLETGVSYIYTGTDAPNFLSPGDTAIPSALPYDYGSQWLATRRVFGTFTTGEDFGRFQDSLDSDNSFYDGSSALRGAHRILLTNDVSYAVNRYISALGEFGYENLSYPAEGYAYVGGVWSAGARITPNAQSSVTLEYRYIDGLTSPYAFGYWQITPRVRVFGAYSEGITTFQQDQQNGLLSGDANATGAIASANLGAPLINNASLFGANQALNRAERASVSLSYIADRDIVTASYNHQRSSPIANLLGLPNSVLAELGISQAELARFGLLTDETSISTQANASWHRDWRPDLASDFQLGYTKNLVAQTTGGQYSSIGVSVAFTKTFARAWSARLGYSGSFFVSGDVGASGLNTNTVTISVSKSF